MSWHRWMAIGCSHGSLADPDAIEAVLRFKDARQPEFRFHLGDGFEFSSFRSGAQGTQDEAMSLESDVAAGCALIAKYEPTHYFLGNHCWRAFKNANHYNAIRARAAASCRDELLEACRKVGARVIDHYDINRSYLKFGDTIFTHGFGLGGENSLRDTAEHFGKSVCAHFHTPGIVAARRSDHATCCCVGWLGDIEKAEYAATRRATAKWGHGLGHGEFSDTYCHIELSRCEQGQAKNWRLPG